MGEAAKLQGWLGPEERMLALAAGWSARFVVIGHSRGRASYPIAFCARRPTLKRDGRRSVLRCLTRTIGNVTAFIVPGTSGRWRYYKRGQRDRWVTCGSLIAAGARAADQARGLTAALNGEDPDVA